jgi:hypothetical protein
MLTSLTKFGAVPFSPYNRAESPITDDPLPGSIAHTKPGEHLQVFKNTLDPRLKPVGFFPFTVSAIRSHSL